ncbi:hypothetical protein [Thermaerobacillus caldiproteolyticus]|uniref:Uncharacterized protein n=1 Tax=Thermaerobacillus caldiproteolyticus TaxID=247480 RepID=A0A7V9Z595_9BACL|nr:hypothetical protein [Anoxybacillus caldiproteolyticus]MBA2874289.1 hypothetical protein [Anoxybacillus caldiproteolyticus]
MIKKIQLSLTFNNAKKAKLFTVRSPKIVSLNPKAPLAQRGEQLSKNA